MYAYICLFLFVVLELVSIWILLRNNRGIDELSSDLIPFLMVVMPIFIGGLGLRLMNVPIVLRIVAIHTMLLIEIICTLILPDIDRVYFNGRNKLHRAAKSGNIPLIKELIGLGYNVNSVDNVGYTPIGVAVQYKQIAAIEYLISHGADLISQYGKNYTTSILGEAARTSIQIVRFIYEHYFNDKQIESDVLILAVKSNMIDIVDYLLSKEIMLGYSTHYGEAPLHAAIRNKNWKIVERLLQAGADMTENNIQKQAPLDMINKLNPKEKQCVYILLDDYLPH